MTGKHGSIVLFVKNLPETVSREELKAHFRKFIKPRWHMRVTGRNVMGSCDIIRITNPGNRKVEYHGLVELQPALLALRAMREMNGLEINGQRIEIRRYQHRSPMRDRRKGAIHARIAGETDNRRATERRRGDLQVDLVALRGSNVFRSMAQLLQPGHPAKNYGT